MAQITYISDISFAWINCQDFNPTMKDLLFENPNTLVLLRATFMKFSSILNVPLIRIIEADSSDFDQVSEYYSDQLVEFVKDIIQIIPSKVFTLLQKIASIHLSLPEIEGKIERDRFKEIAQLAKRSALADYTYEISSLTQGIFALEDTLVGIIQINPQQLLEEGIRYELGVHINHIFQSLN